MNGSINESRFYFTYKYKAPEHRIKHFQFLPLCLHESKNFKDRIADLHKTTRPQTTWYIEQEDTATILFYIITCPDYVAMMKYVQRFPHQKPWMTGEVSEILTLHSKGTGLLILGHFLMSSSHSVTLRGPGGRVIFVEVSLLKIFCG